MKILIVNTQDISGGAARATYRLHRALLKEGVDSSMLVQKKSSDDFTVLSKSGKVQRALSSLRPTLDILPTYFYKNRDRTLFSPAWLPFSFVVDEINKLNPDIVHLHWICGGLMKIEDIAKIKAPIVWSLHDNWAFTGGCHIMWECEKYKNRCGVCPRLGSSKERDLSRRVFERKEKSFSKIKTLTVVGLSRWLYEASKSSRLLKDKEHVYLPNLIDTTLYKPFDKEKARELWNLPKDKKLILFGAMSAMSDINKGFKELYEALQLLSTKNIELVIFGSSKPKNPPKFPFHTHYLGHIHDDVSLVTLYSSVDVMVVPSLQEAFGQTAMEAMACKVAVVAFNSTGLKDIVDHKINGYLAKPYEPYDLAKGIEWVLEAPNYKELCQNAREKVLREFDSKVVAKKYIKLYQEVLNEKE
jgi:glycosyltransferase involved in cell wall biosynthesis